MMITQKVFIKNTITDLPFNGDPTKDWYCEIVDSNHNSTGNPRVVRVRSGYITIDSPPRCLNAELTLIFHTQEDKETGAVEALEKNIVKATADGFKNGVSKTLKWVGVSLAGFVTLSIAISVISYFFNIEKIKRAYQSFNAVNAADGITGVVQNREEYSRVATNSYDEVFLSKDIVEKEEKLKIKYSELFWYVGDGVFFMRDLVKDKEGKVVLSDKEDADEYCSNLGAKVLSSENQNTIFSSPYLPFVTHDRDTPQWTSDNPSGDDYVILLENGKGPDNSYRENGLLMGDEDDVKAGFRCGFHKSKFIEEDD